MVLIWSSSKFCRLTLSHTTDLDSSKLNEFADDNSNFNENDRKLFKRVENTVGKEAFARLDFSFSLSVFKGLILRIRKNQSC